MKNLPILRQLTQTKDFTSYATAYEQCSGLPVPVDYLQANKTFALELNGKMIGGFILGMGPEFRTIQFFASETNQSALREKLIAPEKYTEITCFWLDKGHRSKSLTNLLTWVKLAWAIKKNSNPYVLFGTNSTGLACLYNSSKHTFLIHEDICKDKKTFVFVGRTRYCFTGILQIIIYKIQRMINRTRKQNQKRNLNLHLHQEIPFSIPLRRKAA